MTGSVDALIVALPVFAGLTVAEDGQMEICQSYKAATGQELRGVLLKYQTGDRLAVKRFPDGWKVEITRSVTAEALEAGVKLD